MSDATAARALLQDAFQRVRDQVVGVTDGLTEEIGTFRPDAGANTVNWLVWHLSRVQDDHVAALAGREQVWPQWRDRFGLPFEPDATGYGQSPDDVAAVRVDAALLAGYHAEVHRLTADYLAGLTVEELERVVDPHWDPPVTAAVRLLSVIGDTVAHLGQAGYVRGLAERQPPAGSAEGR